MIRGEQGAALRHVQVLFDVGTIGSLTDRQLLEQFHDPHRSRGRGGIRRAGRSPRADGHPHLPVHFAERARGGRRVSGDVPGAGAASGFALGPRIAWPLAVSGGNSRVILGAEPPRFAADGMRSERPSRRNRRSSIETATTSCRRSTQELARLPEQFRAAVRALLHARPLAAASGRAARLAAGNPAKPPAQGAVSDCAND